MVEVVSVKRREKFKDKKYQEGNIRTGNAPTGRVADNDPSSSSWMATSPYEC